MKNLVVDGKELQKIKVMKGGQLRNVIGKAMVKGDIDYPPELEGGRNLHKDTSNEWREEYRPEGSWYFQQSTDIKLELGETYTFSIIVERVSDDTVPINLDFSIGNNSFSWDRSHWGNIQDIPMGEKITKTFTVSEEDLSRGYETFAWRLRNNKRETTIRFKEVKLEKSSTPTDWTPAPEDLGLVYPNEIQSFPQLTLKDFYRPINFKDDFVTPVGMIRQPVSENAGVIELRKLKFDTLVSYNVY